jgi:hypothetical protein
MDGFKRQIDYIKRKIKENKDSRIVGADRTDTAKALSSENTRNTAVATGGGGAAQAAAGSDPTSDTSEATAHGSATGVPKDDGVASPSSDTPTGPRTPPQAPRLTPNTASPSRGKSQA